LVGGVAGPAIFAAAAWTLLTAQQDNIGTLYFVARDGEILLAAAESLQRELGMAPEIECRYLYGSRKAWHVPALSLVPGTDFPAALRRLLLLKSENSTLRGLLSYLDMSVDEVAPIAAAVVGAIAFDTPLGDQLGAVVDALANSSAFQSLALSRAQAAHKATIAYLRQEQMFGDSRVGLVDIGWHGAASASLAIMAAAEGTEVVCYFTGGLCGRESLVAPKDSRAYLIDARGDEPADRPALVHLLETFCAGTGGSTLGYMAVQDRWAPRLAAAETNPAMLWGLRDYQALVRSYVTAACHNLAKFQWRITLDEISALRPYLIANIRTLWNYPAHAEAELWGTFPFEGDTGTAMLARAIAPRDLAGVILHFRNSEKRPRFGPWTRAVVARTVGGGRFVELFSLPHIASSPSQRQLLLARVRNKLALRPVVHVEDIRVEDCAITIYRQR
jgi:hypothetical protein